MAGGKETPRQKMIGLMYLVLMALLAMNVSKSVLNAFIVINDGLTQTNDNFAAKNQTTYNLFAKAKMNDPIKAGPWYDKALKVQAKANEIYDYITELKHQVIAFTDGVPVEQVKQMKSLYEVNSKDNYDKPTEFLIGQEVTNPKKGEWTATELKDKIDEYRNFLINDILKGDTAGMHLGLDTDIEVIDNGTKEDWISLNFYHLPLVAVVTNLTKIQSDVRNAEADVVKKLYSHIDAGDFKFDTLAVKVIPNTNYLILGDTFKADVIVAAFSKTQNPILEVGFEVDSAGNIIGEKDTAGVRVKNGVAQWIYKPEKEGIVEWGGVIKIKKPDGTYQPFPFKHQFTVAKPTLVVSPTAMNVFYRGLDNPVEVSVPGVPTDKLQVSISNASVSGSNGKYKVRPGKGKECIVTVSADINGKKQNFGQMKFRVKNVPDPKPKFAGSYGGNIQRNKLLAAQGVVAEMQNFEFDLRFVVVSFDLTANIKGNLVSKTAKGPRLTGDMKTILKSLKPGSKFYIEKIKAKGPDGTIRDLGTLAFKVV
ncbi:MAG: gliding motility protein GldM [Bacteroidetes bacterium]|nr:MAG: gliding motility protein GldM [Bacteroidota bacterium]